MKQRQTRQQQAVVQAIRDSGRSLSPQEVWALAQQVVPRINLSTVYRQLKALCEKGQVVRVQLPGQTPRYETARLTPQGLPNKRRVVALNAADQGASTPSHHHHFHCVACEQVFPLHACPGGMDKLVPRGYEVQRHDLTLHGRCPRCVSGAAA